MARNRQPPPSGGNGRSPWWVAGLTLAAAASGAVWLVQARQRRHEKHRVDDAPPWSRKRREARGYATVGRTVTIDRPRPELYRFWRDFSNLPRFMENVRAVETLSDKRSRWTLEAPGGGTAEIISELVVDRENEVIAWRSTEGSDIETHGSVTFRDAPGGRGTEIEAVIAYKPPAGELGRLIAKLAQREPAIQSRRELKRLKMLMETGEIASSRSLDGSTAAEAN